MGQIVDPVLQPIQRSGYSVQQIGKLLGYESGSSMTVMYADLSDDEVIETAQPVTFAQIEKAIYNVLGA
jgi:hypothetical protein